MNDKTTPERTRRYSLDHEQWYAPRLREAGAMHNGPAISIGVDADDGTLADFRIEWHSLGRELSPRLMAFCDAWQAPEFAEVAAALAPLPGPDGLLSPTVAAVAAVLDRLGFADVTERDQGERERALSEGERRRLAADATRLEACAAALRKQAAGPAGGAS
jgi:hypothetical protein